MWKIGKILILVTLILQSSCDGYELYDCADCLLEEPIDCELIIDLTRNYDPANLFHVIVYQGKIEDGVIIEERNTSGSFSMIVPLNVEYSVWAQQVIVSKEYISINSSTPKVDYEEDYCENPCYFIKGSKINLKFKYY